MGHQLIRQDDGLWSVYSTVCDVLLCVDMEPQDVANHYFGRGSDTAKRRRWIRCLNRGVNPQVRPGPHNDPQEIRDALAWTWHGNNPSRRPEEAPSPEDPLNSAIGACRKLPWFRVRKAMDELVSEGRVSRPFRRSRSKRQRRVREGME